MFWRTCICTFRFIRNMPFKYTRKIIGDKNTKINYKSFNQMTHLKTERRDNGFVRKL